MKWIFILTIAIFIIPGCDIKERERAVQEKENELALKEQRLNERELALQLAEAEFAKRQQVDTTQSDSAFVYEHKLLGDWNTKMVCTQAICSGSAIGDTKIETWSFYYENKQLVVRATVSDKLIRVYTGKIVNNAIELEENIEPSKDEPATTIAVRLKIQNERALDGQREILRPNCKIVYSLQLTRQNNP